MSIANYSTDVPVSRTLGHVMGMLAAAGASSITQHVGEDKAIIGIDFAIQTESGWQGYRMPVRIDAVHAVLRADRLPPRQQTREHAARVAWRIAHDWLRAQIALIEADMASLPEVMFPYARLGDGQTAFETFQQRQLER